MTERGQGKLRVLWATDGSEAARSAVPALRQLVLPETERLVALAVAPHSFLSGARPDPAFLTRIRPAAKRKSLAEGEAMAREEATRLGPPRGVKVEAIARWGNPIEEILRVARTMPADLIVMGAKGHSNLGMLLLGSVSHGVVQHATRPVLIARPGTGNVDRVLVGYESTAPARRALQFLNRLALPRDAEIIVSHVVEPFTATSGMPVAYRKQALEEAHKITERRERGARRTLETAAAPLKAAGRKVTTEVLLGEAPGPELEAAARQHNAELIVVGSRKPSPARHYLLGSTAEKLVRHAPMSVLVVR
jgi:nucleotide-binding universal stress UspA family protein